MTFYVILHSDSTGDSWVVIPIFWKFTGPAVGAAPEALEDPARQLFPTASRGPFGTAKTTAGQLW